MSLYQPLAFPRDADERRHERHDVTLPGRVRELGSPAGGGQIKDLSIGGCRIRDTDLPRHAEIWITLGNAPPMRARVVWVGAGEAGCEFYAPLSRSGLRAIMLQRDGQSGAHATAPRASGFAVHD
jgi:hypothetical protein